MKSLCLIGRCGNETVKKILKEEKYNSHDFYDLKRWVLKNYRRKILASERKTYNDNEIDISFSFIDKDGNVEKIYFLSEKIIKYYSRCEGRIYWSYKLPKYEEPKLVSIFENTKNPENLFTGRIPAITDDFLDVPDLLPSRNILEKPFEFNSDFTSSSNKFSNMRSDNRDGGENRIVGLSNYFKDNEFFTHNFLSQSDPITKDNSQKTSEFDYKSSTAFKEPLYISPAIYNTPTITKRDRYKKVIDAMEQIKDGLLKTTFCILQYLIIFIPIGLIVGLIVVILYLHFKYVLNFW